MILFQILQQVGGDVDAAIEFLIAEKTTEEYVVKNGEAPCTAETSNGNGWLVHFCCNLGIFTRLY